MSYKFIVKMGGGGSGNWGHAGRPGETGGSMPKGDIAGGGTGGGWGKGFGNIESAKDLMKAPRKALLHLDNLYSNRVNNALEKGDTKMAKLWGNKKNLIRGIIKKRRIRF